LAKSLLLQRFVPSFRFRQNNFPSFEKKTFQPPISPLVFPGVWLTCEVWGFFFALEESVAALFFLLGYSKAVVVQLPPRSPPSGAAAAATRVFEPDPI
jgi:hypothetical protein